MLVTRSTQGKRNGSAFALGCGQVRVRSSGQNVLRAIVLSFLNPDALVPQLSFVLHP